MKSIRTLLFALPVLFAVLAFDASAQQAVTFPSGGYALQLAIAVPSLKAVAINYGALATDKSSLAKIHAAVLGNFGGQDHGIAPGAVHCSRPRRRLAGSNYPRADSAVRDRDDRQRCAGGEISANPEFVFIFLG